MSPPIRSSITSAAIMNGPLPPDFGGGGVVEAIRTLPSVGTDYSDPPDGAREILECRAPGDDVPAGFGGRTAPGLGLVAVTLRSGARRRFRQDKAGDGGISPAPAA